jgi:hypothetical protein
MVGRGRDVGVYALRFALVPATFDRALNFRCHRFATSHTVTKQLSVFVPLQQNMERDTDREKRVLITKGRAEILENYDSKNSTHRTRKYRLQKSTKTVLDELIEIAQSPNIDNTEVFDPNQIDRLISTLVGAYGLWPDPDHLTDNVNDDYQNDLLARLGRIVIESQSDP